MPILPARERVSDSPAADSPSSAQGLHPESRGGAPVAVLAGQTPHPCSKKPQVQAAVDVTGHPQFVYVAARHGTLAADNALARRPVLHRDPMIRI
jgi:pyruvate/2-oxoglutarate dehydrogenase complex dihydrolipoamide dehydrogenase (E3) component